MNLFMDRGAEFSACRTYRYALWRKWDPSKRKLVFLMLNPSTADETVNDPTVERCERRARVMGYGGLYVLNLFALRSTDRSVLRKVEDPIGPENDRAITAVVREIDVAPTDVICAWGKDGRLLGRDRAVLSLLQSAGVTPRCLGTNGDGTPKHPLYVPYDVTPVEFSLRP